MVLGFAKCRRWHVNTGVFVFRRGIFTKADEVGSGEWGSIPPKSGSSAFAFRESRGNGWPTALLARCSGLHNKDARRKPKVFSHWPLCIEGREFREAQGTRAVRGVCDRLMWEQDPNTDRLGRLLCTSRLTITSDSRQKETRNKEG